MKKTILKISIRLACFGILLSGVLASAQATVWSKAHLESTGFDATKPNFVATADGAVYVTGHYKAAINVGSSIPNLGGSDIYLIKYDSNGNVLWAKGFGGAADDTVNAITADASGNVYLGGTFNSSTIAFGATTLNASATSLFVVKIDSSGTVVWAKGSTQQTLNKDAIKALVVDATGNVYAGGDFSNGVLKFDTTSLSNTSSTSDFFIEKMDASGALQWAKSFGGNLNDNLNGLALSNGNVIAVGSFVSSTVTLSNSQTLTNTTSSSAAPFSDIFVVAFNASGVAQWQRTLTGDKLDVAKAVATGTDGYIYVVGNTKSSTLTINGATYNNPITYLRSFLLKLNTSGDTSKLVFVDLNTLDAVCVNSNSNTVYVSGRVNPDVQYKNIAVAFKTENLDNRIDYSNATSELYSSSIAVDANDYLILGTYGKDKTSISKKIRTQTYTTNNLTIADLPANGTTYFTAVTGGTALVPTDTVTNGQFLFGIPSGSSVRNAILINIVTPSSPPPVSHNYFLDSDGDGYGSTTSITSFLSTPPAGYALNYSDCDDTDATKFTTYYKYVDADADGHLKLVSTICAGATAPTGYVSVAQIADDCDDTNATVFPGAFEITNEYMDFNGLDNDCNGYVDDAKVTTTYITAITNYFYCQKVRNAQKYKFYVTNSYSGLSWEIETTEPKIRVNELSGVSFIYEDYFSVAVALKRNNVWLPYGPTQYVSTQTAPTTSINGGQCGKTFADTNQIISVNPVYLADSYTIRLDTESEMVYYDIPNGGTQFSLNIFPASSSNVYHISVTFKQGNKVFNYGQNCDLNIKSSIPTTPPTPTLSATQMALCGTTLIALRQSIYCVRVNGAVAYRFRVNGGVVVETPNIFFNLTQVGGQLGTTYVIEVASSYNGVIWTPYGASCSVTTPSPSARHIADFTEFAVAAYPNPFNSAFKLQVNASTDETIFVSVYDMMGKQVEHREIKASEIENSSLGQEYATGIYNVLVSQGEKTKTVRLVKN